jgi:hypothetical protein
LYPSIKNNNHNLLSQTCKAVITSWNITISIEKTSICLSRHCFRVHFRPQ